MVRLSKGRVLLLILAIDAGIVAVGFGMAASNKMPYEGRATVFMNRVFGESATGYDLDPYVATFQTALQFPETTVETAGATGVPEAAISDRLSSVRAAQSTIVEVLYKPAVDLESARTVPQEAALITLRNLVEGEAERGRARVRLAQENLDAARAELLGFEERTGFVDLDAEYAGLLAELREGTAGQGSRDRLTELNQLRTERDELLGELEGQQSVLNGALSEVATAESRMAAIESPGVIVTSEPRRESRLPLVLRAVVGGAFLGAVPMLALFALLDRRARNRRVHAPVTSPRSGRPAEGGRGTGDVADRLDDPAPAGVVANGSGDGRRPTRLEV